MSKDTASPSDLSACLSSSQVAEQFGVSRVRVGQWARTYGLVTFRFGKETAYPISELAKIPPREERKSGPMRYRKGGKPEGQTRKAKPLSVTDRKVFESDRTCHLCGSALDPLKHFCAIDDKGAIVHASCGARNK
jgi:hypothetical protein